MSFITLSHLWVFRASLRQNVCCFLSVHLYLLFPCHAGLLFSLGPSSSLSRVLSVQMSGLSLSVSFICPAAAAAPSIKEIVPVLINIQLSKPTVQALLSSFTPSCLSLCCLTLSFSCFQPPSSLLFCVLFSNTLSVCLKNTHTVEAAETGTFCLQLQQIVCVCVLDPSPQKA